MSKFGESLRAYSNAVREQFAYGIEQMRLMVPVLQAQSDAYLKEYTTQWLTRQELIRTLQARQQEMANASEMPH